MSFDRLTSEIIASVKAPHVTRLQQAGVLLLFLLAAGQICHLTSQTAAPSHQEFRTQASPPTLPELYGMFFNFAAHVDANADANEKLGKDWHVYRQHLQIASGLTPEQYQSILTVAKSYTSLRQPLNEAMSRAAGVQDAVRKSRHLTSASTKALVSSYRAQQKAAARRLNLFGSLGAWFRQRSAF